MGSKSGFFLNEKNLVFTFKPLARHSENWVKNDFGIPNIRGIFGKSQELFLRISIKEQ